MAVYVTRRFLTLIPVWLGVTLVAFTFVHAIPGGPFDTGAVRSEETERVLRERFSLGEPFLVQYGMYVRGIVRDGNLGESITQRGLTVTRVIQERFPTSALLGISGFVVAVVIGMPLGILTAARQNRFLDHALMFFATIGYSVPNFVLSILLILIAGLKLGLLPLGGWGEPEHLILPALALGLPWAGLIARLTRSAMLEALTSEYIVTALGKGLSYPTVVLRHALRNALIPVITIMPILVAEMITGSFVIESMFGIAGLGQYVLESVVGRDYSMLLGFVVFYATLIFVANLIVDVTYAWLDPRIRIS